RNAARRYSTHTLSSSPAPSGTPPPDRSPYQLHLARPEPPACVPSGPPTWCASLWSVPAFPWLKSPPTTTNSASAIRVFLPPSPHLSPTGAAGSGKAGQKESMNDGTSLTTDSPPPLTKNGQFRVSYGSCAPRVGAR